MTALAPRDGRIRELDEDVLVCLRGDVALTGEVGRVVVRVAGTHEETRPRYRHAASLADVLYVRACMGAEVVVMQSYLGALYKGYV